MKIIDDLHQKPEMTLKQLSKVLNCKENKLLILHICERHTVEPFNSTPFGQEAFALCPNASIAEVLLSRPERP